VILVNNGSNDETASVLEKIKDIEEKLGIKEEN
jgi:glycosyltransferase involved in cell wall biosynthesis